MSPKAEKMSSTFVKPPAPAPAPWSNAWCPNWSYRRRFSWSPTTSYASAASLNLASALALSGFWSGWYLRASLRYAFLISAASADLLIPSAS